MNLKNHFFPFFASLVFIGQFAQADTLPETQDASWYRQRISELNSVQGSLDYLGDHCNQIANYVENKCVLDGLTKLAAVTESSASVDPGVKNAMTTLKTKFSSCRYDLGQGVSYDCYKQAVKDFQDSGAVSKAVATLSSKLPKTADDNDPFGKLQALRDDYNTLKPQVEAQRAKIRDLSNQNASCRSAKVSTGEAATNRVLASPQDTTIGAAPAAQKAVGTK